MKNSEDLVLFLVKELSEAGVDSGEKFDKLLPHILKAGNYIITPWKADDFFTELATKLRDLWPSGMKDGKWPWRDSVKNLADRLKELWEIKGLGTKYSIDDCLFVARRYLAQFEEDRKYMKLLKYFIGKRNEVYVKKDGHIKYEIQSDLTNMLESMSDEDTMEQDIEKFWMDEAAYGADNLV